MDRFFRPSRHSSLKNLQSFQVDDSKNGQTTIICIVRVCLLHITPHTIKFSRRIFIAVVLYIEMSILYARGVLFIFIHTFAIDKMFNYTEFIVISIYNGNDIMIFFFQAFHSDEWCQSIIIIQLESNCNRITWLQLS